jgi:hypothetical protein
MPQRRSHNQSLAKGSYAASQPSLAFRPCPVMPELLRALLALDFDYADGEGIDFEPFETFLSASETSRWFQAWTGNQDANAADFLVFGQDGTGGYAVIWNVRKDGQLLDQPVAFLGAEGQTGVVASTVYEFLWLLAGGLGPFEAVAYPSERPENIQFAAFAIAHSPETKKSAMDVVKQAKAEFPDFEQRILAVCR